MKHFLLLLVLCGAAFGQGVRYDIPPILNAQGRPIANPQITLCTGTATITGSTCNTPTQSFTDITTTTLCSISTPVTLTNSNVCQATGDALGNGGFWLASGAYIYCVNAPSTTGKCFNLTVPVGVTAGGTATVIGTLTAGSINGTVYVCSSCQFTTLAAAIAAASNGTTIVLAGGTFPVSSTINVTQTGLKILGSQSNGFNVSNIQTTFASGDLFTINGQFFELGNLGVVSSVVRTSGNIINTTQSTGNAAYGYVHDILADSTYGGFKITGTNSNAATGWRFYRITFKVASNTQHCGSQFFFGGTDNTIGIADAIVQDVFTPVNLCIFDAPANVADAGSDTITWDKYDAGYSVGNTSTQPVFSVQFSGGGLAVPQGIKIQGRWEGGGATSASVGLSISNGNNIALLPGSSITNILRSIDISGGNNISVLGSFFSAFATTTTGGCIRTTTAGTYNLTISGNKFASCSLTTTNTSSDIELIGGTVGVTIAGNMHGVGTPANKSKYGVNLLTGVSNMITVMDDFNTAQIATQPILDSSSGVDKRIFPPTLSTFVVQSDGAYCAIFTDQAGIRTSEYCSPGSTNNGRVGTTSAQQFDFQTNGTTRFSMAAANGHLLGATSNSDLQGKLTCAASTVTKTFANAFTSTPVVIVFDETTKGGANLTAISNSAFTVSCTGATDALDYWVFGNPN